MCSRKTVICCCTTWQYQYQCCQCSVEQLGTGSACPEGGFPSCVQSVHERTEASILKISPPPPSQHQLPSIPPSNNSRRIVYSIKFTSTGGGDDANANSMPEDTCRSPQTPAAPTQSHSAPASCLNAGTSASTSLRTDAGGSMVDSLPLSAGCISESGSWGTIHAVGGFSRQWRSYPIPCCQRPCHF